MPSLKDDAASSSPVSSVGALIMRCWGQRLELCGGSRGGLDRLIELVDDLFQPYSARGVLSRDHILFTEGGQQDFAGSLAPPCLSEF
ncbi:MAG: hypothetical protein ACYC3X_11655 [Pirellulaceae bacterium]